MPHKFGAFISVGAIFCLLLSTAGCRSRQISPVGPVERVERDSIIAVLGMISQDAIRTAFSKLNDYSYQRYLRTEQYDVEDFSVAFTEHLVSVKATYEGPQSTITRADSGGAFNFGFFKRFVSENVSNADPVDLVPFVLEDDPIYLNPKNLDKYTFRAQGDTLMWDREARIIEVRAKPDAADGLNIRKVRYYVERESNELVAMYLERIDLGMLFREESTFYMHILPVSGGVMLPYNTRFETMIRTPFKRSYRVRTVSTYTDHVLTIRN
ncbi:MAG: hypothetical protein O3B41_08470 [Bacteroidetes bacterium]|nr:hypothetical protein [Bacteroidota bacterium]